MIQRVYGAIRGAGTQVREALPAPPIQDGPLGSSVIVGVFRRGRPLQVATLTGGLPEFSRRNGGLARYSEAPLAAQDFYRMAGGAGTLYTVRVTDGTEVQASRVLYDRDVDTSIRRFTQAAKLPSAVMTVKADNGGRWGGRADYQAGRVNLTSAVTGSSTINLGISCLADQWEGATLRFPVEDTTYTATVVSNTAAGVFTVEGSFPTSISGSSTTSAPWELLLANNNEITDALEAVAVEVADGGEVAASEFGVFAWVDGLQVKAWANLSLSDASEKHWYPAIAEDLDNYEVSPTDSFGGDPNNALHRPANFAELPVVDGVNANVIELQTWRFRVTSPGGATPHVETMTVPDGCPECTITCTFSSGTAFAVTATIHTGETLTLGTGTVDTEFDPGFTWLPAFTIGDIGSTSPSSGNTVVITVRPLPPNLAKKGGKLIAAASSAQGDIRAIWTIVSNTASTITVAPSVDLSTKITAPASPTVTGATAGDYSLSGSETLIFTGVDAATLTSSLGSGTFTAAEVADELNDLEATRTSGRDRPTYVFEATTDNKVKITADVGGGTGAAVTIGSGTLNSILGFTAGSITGTAGQIVRVQWRQELEGGYDGIAGLASSDYEDAWAIGTTDRLNVLLGENTGVLTVSMPGVTTPASQRAMIRWAHATNSIAYTEIPTSVTTEAAAIAWHETNLYIGEENVYTRSPFPSYARRPNPYGAGLYLSPVSGAMLGQEARQALEAGGYHVAPAGVRASLSAIFRDLQSELTGKVLDNELLNAYGLTEIRKAGGQIRVWGDRIAAGAYGRPFYHVRKTNSHVGRILLVNTIGLVFLPINDFTFARAYQEIAELFAPWYRAGWFDDLGGPAFTDQVAIKVDKTNNTAADRAAGNLNIAIGYGVVGTAERVVYTLGPNGLTEG